MATPPVHPAAPSAWVRTVVVLLAMAVVVVLTLVVFGSGWAVVVGVVLAIVLSSLSGKSVNNAGPRLSWQPRVTAVASEPALSMEDNSRVQRSARQPSPTAQALAEDQAPAAVPPRPRPVEAPAVRVARTPPPRHEREADVVGRLLNAARVTGAVLLVAGISVLITRLGHGDATTGLALVLLASGIAVLAAAGAIALVDDLDRRAEARSAASLRASERQMLHYALSSSPTLAGVDLAERDLSGFFLRGKEMDRAQLRSAIMTAADLSDARLGHADLSRAELSRAKLIGARLAEADLTGATLSCADLSRADLSDAKLSHARLDEANLTGARLSNVDLSGADLRGATVIGADLRTSRSIGANFKGVRYGRSTHWPEGFDVEAAGAVLKEE
jgi:uncharacterized protein YjbI with pentapeptide repeats